jgi:hypothetical protein
VREVWGYRIIYFSGVIMMGIGVYFIFFRPPLLPEDLAYMGTSQPINEIIPNLGNWLHRVFAVMGGFMFSTGLLAVGISRPSNASKITPVTNLFSLGAWVSSIGLMSSVNFLINSDFKWHLFVFALIWLTGILLLWPHTKAKTSRI